MTPFFQNFLIFIAVIAAIVGIIAIIYLLITMRNLNKLILILEKETTPILSNLQRTLEQLSNEIDKTVDIIDDVHMVSQKVNTTINIIQEIFTSPLIKLAGLSAGAKKAIQALRQKDRENTSRED